VVENKQISGTFRNTKYKCQTQTWLPCTKC